MRTMLAINDTLCLEPFDFVRAEALEWYRDPGIMKNVIGQEHPFSTDEIMAMYVWQLARGDLYYICFHDGEGWLTIGDVWIAEHDYALVLASDFQGYGFGRTITEYFIAQKAATGADYMDIEEVFLWNKASQKLFTRLGFYPYERLALGWKYRKKLH